MYPERVGIKPWKGTLALYVLSKTSWREGMVGEEERKTILNSGRSKVRERDLANVGLRKVI